MEVLHSKRSTENEDDGNNKLLNILW